MLGRIARLFGVTDREVTGGSRRRPAAARAAVGAVAVTGLGLPVTRVARALPRGAALLKARGLDLAHIAREAGRKSS